MRKSANFMFQRGRVKVYLSISGILFLFLAGLYALHAQTELQITDIKVDSVTKSSARVGFYTNRAGDYGIVYGLDTRYGYQSSRIRAGKAGVGVLTGLPPDQEIHYRVCYLPPANTSQVLCSEDRITRTAKADTAGVARAVEPQIFDAPMPSLTGDVFSVDADCSNFTRQLAAAAAADGNLNHFVTIPAGTFCYGTFDIPVKNGPNAKGDGVIVVRSAVPDEELPPEGMRIGPAWEGSMAHLVNNAIFAGYGGELAKECTPEEFTWLTTYPSVNKYHVCVEKNTWKPLESMRYYSAGTERPASCATGDFFLLEKPKSDVRYSMSRCVTENRWVPVTPRGDGGRAVGNPYQQAIRGYRFVGLIFETAEPEGINYSGLVDIGNYNSNHENVIVDRCIFRVPPEGSATSAISLNGSNIAVMNSWFDMRVVPNLHPYNPVANSVMINITSGTGPFKVYNNYVRGSGFMVFVNDNNRVVPRDDIEIRRNTFTYNERFRCGSPSSDNICRDVRGPIELKRGRRVLFEGNTIENFWSTLSGGQAFIITPRASGSEGPDNNDYQISDLTIRYNIIRNGTGFVQIVGQDDVGYRNTKITQRVTIEHNLVTGIDAYTRADKKYGTNRGQVLAISNGVEDLTFRHNTIIDNRGTAPSFLHISFAAMSGLDFRDNILWVNKSEVGGGLGIRWSEPAMLPNGMAANRANEQAILNATALSIPGTSYDFRNNVVVAGPGVRISDLRSSYPNATANRFVQQSDTGDDPLHFEDFLKNLRLNIASPFKSVSSDGTDPGTDLDNLDRQVGSIRTHWPDEVSAHSATIVFYPPDTYPCLVEVAPDADFRNPQRFRDSSAGERHTIPVANLQSGHHYFYRLSCASATVTGEFDTLGAAQ